MIDDPERLGLLERASEAVGMEDGRDVEQRPLGRGDRQPVEPGGVPCREIGHAMEAHAGVAAVPARAPDRDVHRPAPDGQEVPRRGGVAMAEDGVRPGRQHGSPPPPARGQGEMAHGVDAAVEPVKRPPLDAPADGAAVEPRRPQLPDADDAGLGCGEVGDRPIRMLDGLLSHGDNKASSSPDPPPESARPGGLRR